VALAAGLVACGGESEHSSPSGGRAATGGAAGAAEMTAGTHSASGAAGQGSGGDGLAAGSGSTAGSAGTGGTAGSAGTGAAPGAATFAEIPATCQCPDGDYFVEVSGDGDTVELTAPLMSAPDCGEGPAVVWATIGDNRFLSFEACSAAGQSAPCVWGIFDESPEFASGNSVKYTDSQGTVHVLTNAALQIEAIDGSVIRGAYEADTDGELSISGQFSVCVARETHLF